jgi:glycosyltransferase involved in cell wall biosynthesis
MKLIVQIPAYNEGETIAEVLADIPRTIPGVDSVEVLVVDDGSRDDTVSIALAHGVDYVARHVGNKGLAFAYQTGIDTALRLGADIIVNTDGDHQYSGTDIPQLIAPILEGRADVVIGDRQVNSIEHFSPLKKTLQHVGSGVVRWASGTDVSDTVSGFRALSREAALRTFVTSDFSYTVENLIQAGKRRLTITTVPITVQPTRPSRLSKNTWHFVKRQASTIVRTYATHEPLKTFSYIAAPFMLIGAILLGRAFYIFLMRQIVNNYPESNVQSLVGGATLLIVGFVILMFGLLADLIGSVRRRLDEGLYRIRKQEVTDEAWRREVDARLTQLEQALLEPLGHESQMRER